MKTGLKLCIVGLSVGLLGGCSKSADPSATSSVSVKLSASTASGSNVINGRISSRADSRGSANSTTGITITDVKVNVRDIKFDFDRDDRHAHEPEFKKDTAYSGDNDPKLKGPFLVDLMNAGSFVDKVVASVNLPNAKYERVRFKLVPDSASGDMLGKSILITGKIDSIPFVFWHKRDVSFGARFSDSNPSDSTLSTTGGAVTMAIHFELDKILDALNGGVDLTKAVDGNKDGIITIDPNNDDGNKWLADWIMMVLIRHAHCERRDH
jgi:hypothetical protein